MCKFKYDTDPISKPSLFALVQGAALIVAGLLLSGCGAAADDPSETWIQVEDEALTSVVQINSGGTAVESFQGDGSFNGGSTFSSTSAVTTSGVTGAAPASVYQSERYGNFSYTVSGLSAGASYVVRLHFAEIYFSAVGSRVFNTSINGTQVLTNFDIYSAAGAANKAVVREFNAVASNSGQIVISYVGVKDNAKSSGIEVLSAAQTPPPPSSGDVRLDSGGGGAVGPFGGDQFFSGGSTFSSTASVSTTGVTNAGPPAVYQSERYGNFSYTIGGLTAGAQYTVRLHFAEIYFTAAGSRLFNTSINGTQVLNGFDVFSAAGSANKAVVRDFNANADGQGRIVISYTGVKDNATSSGIEVLSGGGSTPPPSNQAPTVASNASASPSTVNGTTTTLSVLGADDGGEANLTYTWTTTGTPPAAVTFGSNGSNAAKSTTATFSASGNYSFRVTIADAQGLTTTSTVSVGVTIPTGLPGGSGWKLAFSDEFNGSSVDTGVWKYWLDGQTRRAAVNRAANTFVGGGVLTVRTTMTNGQLTAGGLESRRGFGYGYFEVRAKVQGWSAFWLQSFANGNGGTPAQDGTEMDIMETCCGPANHAVHWGGYGSSHQYVMQTVTVPTSSDWNTYGLEWTPTTNRFWVNGQLSWTFTQAISQRSDEVVRLTQETDGDYCGGQCDMVVDYVRVYTPN